MTYWLVVTYPSEIYEFVSWDDGIPNVWINKIHVPNHQPVYYGYTLVYYATYGYYTIVYYTTYGYYTIVSYTTLLF